jgi:hypothetical protein
MIVPNLMCYVWSSIADVTIHLSHHANMFVTIEQGELLVPDTGF